VLELSGLARLLCRRRVRDFLKCLRRRGHRSPTRRNESKDILKHEYLLALLIAYVI
jgi:hypothetical protein